MSTLTAKEQALYDAAKAALPSWMFTDAQAAQELIGALAKLMNTARTAADGWVDDTYILLSSGIWLDQLAKDRGTARQANESDAQLQYRLRNLQDLVTLPALTAIMNQALAADGLPTGAILELRQYKGFTRRAANAGTTVHQGAFASRGYRCGSKPPKNTIIVILPYGTSPGLAASIAESIRQSKAGGITQIIEVRGVP